MAWSKIYGDCLGNIAEKLTTISDYRSLRLVCRDWASTVPNIPRHRVSIPPLLMLPKLQHAHKNCKLINVISEDNTNTFRAQCTNLPGVSPTHRVVGSSHGYLIVVELTGQIYCLNPVTKDRVALPQLSEFPDVEQFYLLDDHEGYYRVSNQFGYPQNLNLVQMRDWYVKKIILTSSPETNEAAADFMALAIVQSGSQLAYCKRGDAHWSFIPLSFVPDAHRTTEDVVYNNGLLSGLSYGLKGEELTICDFSDHSSPTTEVISAEIPHHREFNIRMHEYLVSSEDEEGGLFLVSRQINKDYAQKICVYKFDAARKSWVSQETLNGKMMFVGLNSSLSFQATDFRGCKANTIYFSSDMEMFNLSDQKIQKLPCFAEITDPPMSSNNPAIWFTPNPW